MRAEGQSSVEIAIEEIVRHAFVEMRVSDTENDQRLIEMATQLGSVQRQLSEALQREATLVNENERLREDLERERQTNELAWSEVKGAA